MKSKFNIVVENVFIPADDGEVVDRQRLMAIADKVEFIKVVGRVPDIGEWLRVKYYDGNIAYWCVELVEFEGIGWRRCWQGTARGRFTEFNNPKINITKWNKWLPINDGFYGSSKSLDIISFKQLKVERAKLEDKGVGKMVENVFIPADDGECKEREHDFLKNTQEIMIDIIDTWNLIPDDFVRIKRIDEKLFNVNFPGSDIGDGLCNYKNIIKDIFKNCGNGVEFIIYISGLDGYIIYCTRSFTNKEVINVITGMEGSLQKHIEIGKDWRKFYFGKNLYTCLVTSREYSI